MCDPATIASLTGREVSRIRMEPGIGTLDAEPLQAAKDIEANPMEIAQQLWRRGPMQTGAKAFMASIPGIRSLQIGNKTSLERFTYELDIAEREVKGRKLEQALLKRRRGDE